MKAHRSRVILMLLAFAVFFLSSAATAQETSGTKVYNSGMKSAVLVHNIASGSQGSGSVVNLKDGYILTNWHVVRGGTEMGILFPLFEKNRPVVDPERYNSLAARKSALVGRVVASDEKIDLAIIKLVQPASIPQGTKSVKFAADSPQVGFKIISIGNPAASESLWVYTPGEVRQVYKKKWVSGSQGKMIGDHEARIIEATSPTSPGDSGGPCFNETGELVGVTQGGLKSSVAQGYSYFIDCSEAKNFLRSKKFAFNVANDEVLMAKGTDPKKDPEPAVNPDPTKGPEPKKEPEPKKDPAATDMAKLEKEAGNRLNLIRSVAKDPSKKTFASEQLKKIIAMYPKTEAAKEAQTLLNSLKN